MTPRLVFRPEAEAELLDARSWYEAERVGLGAVFAAAVETTIAEVLQNPLAYPRVRGDTRRALVRRFPYAVYFRPTADEIVVLAVHARPPEPTAVALPPLSLTSGMAKLSVLYDREGRTLTVWFSDRHQEHVCEETGEEVVLMKNAAGRVIGFEKLDYFDSRH